MPKFFLVCFFDCGSFSQPTYPEILIIGYLCVGIVINKDFFSGQSVPGRVLGYQVVDNKTDMPANSFRCALRNCTLGIWPLENLISHFSKYRGLGDWIAGTKLIKVNHSDPKLILNGIKVLKKDALFFKTIILSFIIASIYLTLTLYFLYKMNPHRLSWSY